MRFLSILCLTATALTAQSLTTTFASNNGQSGNMFDVVGKQSVVISHLDVNLDPGAWDLEVYVVTGGGSYVGKEADATLWTLVGSVTDVVSSGFNVPTPLPLGVQTPVAAGQVQGFYVTVSNGIAMNYTNATVPVGTVYVEDANIRILVGAGSAYPFAGLATPRIWNGTIYYVPAVPDDLTTTFTGSNGAHGNMFDIEALDPVAITDFDVSLRPGTWDLEVYIVAGGGTFVGNETNAAAWTLVGAVGGVISNGLNVPTPLPMAVNTLIPAGGRQGFYVTVTSAGPTTTAMTYTGGTGLGNLYAQDDHIRFFEGVGNTYPFASVFTPRIWNGNVHYVTIPELMANNVFHGQGCGYTFRSFYETFDSVNAFDLDNKAFKWNFLGNRYLVDDVVATFVPPTAGLPPVAGGVLDGHEVFTLSAPMPTLGGPSTTLDVFTKGYIATAAGNPVDFNPTGPKLLAFPENTFACWHDFNQSLTGSGIITFEEVGGVAYATWNGVYTHSSTLPKTMQFQFELATGDVTLVIGDFIGGTSGIRPAVVGFSPGGSSLDPANSDISAKLAAGAIVLDPTDNAVNLIVGSSPRIGSNWLLGATNIPSSGLLGVEVLGLSDPGIDDLEFLGMPRCGLHASLDVLNPWFINSGIHSYSLLIPDSLQLLGTSVYTTVVVFQVPKINAFGAITSRGIEAVIGNH